jgi:hypothetical protein
VRESQRDLGIRHRSLYQAKHSYAVLALLDGESPAVVARSLGILGAENVAALFLEQGPVARRYSLRFR